MFSNDIWLFSMNKCQYIFTVFIKMRCLGYNSKYNILDPLTLEKI